MRKVTYKRFDGLFDNSGGSKNYGNIREYKETTVTYTWDKNEELVHRYLSRFYPDLKSMLLEPSITEPSFGAWVRSNDETLQFKTKLCSGISNDDQLCEYKFNTRTSKRFSLIQIVAALTHLKNIRQTKYRKNKK